jgi:NtrC-family two-component system sensor histidine kinase KinB
MTAETPATARAQAYLDLLYSVSRELAVQLDLHELLQRVLQLTLEHIGGASGSILVLDEAGNVIEGALAYDGQVHDHTAEQLTYTYERGLAGWVVSHREPVLVENTRDDPRWVDRPRDDLNETLSAISVPLISRDRIVGVLTTSHPVAGQLTEEDLTLLSAIADQAGIAVENARLFTAEQERRQFASTLQEIARTISSTLDPDQVFRAVLEQLGRVIDYDSASIFLVEDDQLRLVAAYGFDDPERLAGLSLPLSSNLIDANMLRTGQPMVIEDVQQEAGWLKTDQLPESSEIHGWLGAPLKVRDRVVGVLNVDSHQVGAYGPRDVEVVSAFADHAATAVANARLFADSQRQVRATQALAETARVVTGSLDLEDVPQRVLRQTARSLDAEAASLALVDEESGELEFRVATGPGAEGIVGFRLEPGQGIAGWVAEHEEAVAVPDAQSDPRFYDGIDASTGLVTRNGICVPIMVQGKLIGVLEAINLPLDENSSEQLRLLKGIAGLAGTALAHAQLFTETQSARERYAGLFNDSIDPILISDLAGVITEANHRAVEFLGEPLESLLGQRVQDIHTPDLERLPSDLAEIKAGETLSYKSEANNQEGRPVPVEAHVKRIDIDRQPYLQWILRDISERQELDELRSDLTSMIFHDLRSPLGNVMSSLEMLQQTIPEGDETLQAILVIAQRSSRRLSRLVDSLLDLGQLESGRAVLHKEAASLPQTVREAIEEVGPLSEAKGHGLTYEIDDSLPDVEIDIDMIRRVVINLLENAIKYTRTGGQISVEIEGEDGGQRVQVRDTGPGIPPRYQQQIFDKFSRIHHEGRPKGLGLGLAFCRLAVEAHGGRIWVESEEGRGATFSFWLPES